MSDEINNSGEAESLVAPPTTVLESQVRGTNLDFLPTTPPLNNDVRSPNSAGHSVRRSTFSSRRRSDVSGPGALKALAAHVVELGQTQPVLLSSARNDWVEFKKLVGVYWDKGGSVSLSKMISSSATTAYCMYLEVDTLEDIDDDDLALMIDTHHNINLDIRVPDILASCAMARTSTYDERAVSLYMESFFGKIIEPVVELASEKEKIRAFVAGLQPVWLQQMVLRRESRSFRDVVIQTRECIKNIDTHSMVDKYVRGNSVGSVVGPMGRSVAVPATNVSGRTSRPEGRFAAGASGSDAFCRNCDFRVGHLVEQCPNQYCMRCKSLDHLCWSKQCPARIKAAEMKKANNVSATQLTNNVSAGTRRDDTLSRIAAMVEELEAANKNDKVHVHVHKFCMSASDCRKNDDVIIDSGGSSIFVHNAAYFDSNTYHDIDDGDTVMMANGVSEKVIGVGKFMGLSADYVPSLTSTLVGVSSLTASGQAAVFMKDGMKSFDCDDLVTRILNALLEYVSAHNLIRVSANQCSGLYTTSFKNICPSKRVCGTFYQSADLGGYADVVRYFHESWGHPNIEKMCDIVENKLFLNLPEYLTVARIRKYFPTCSACVYGNMAQAPAFSDPVDRVIGLGEEIEIDVKTWSGSQFDNEKLRSFSGAQHSLIGVDVFSRFHLGYTLKSLENLVQYIERIRREVVQRGGVLKVIRCDSAFKTAQVLQYCQLNQIDIRPCIPYDHRGLGIVERYHRTIQDSVMKALDLNVKTHLSKKFWSMAFYDCIFKSNLMPLSSDSKSTPYQRWFGKTFDLKSTPMVPFGTVIMAHLPLELQTTMSGRSFKTYCVGCAPGFKGGLTLYNPLTKRTITRRTFKILGPTEAVVSDVLNRLSFDIDDKIVKEFVPAGRMVTDSQIVQSTSINESISTDKQTVVGSDGDYIGKYSVQSIIAHSGTPMKRSKMKFKVCWTGYPVEQASWVGWSKVRKLKKLVDYIGGVPGLSLLLTHTPKSSFLVASVEGKSITMSKARKREDFNKFIDAKDAELKSMREMGVWSQVDLPADKIPKNLIVDSMLVMNIVNNPDGSYKKHKVRLCARGDMWVNSFGIDTYGGTVLSESVRLFLAIAAEEDMELSSVDVKTAFLYGELKEGTTLYMRRPHDLTDADMPPIVKLKKCIYGLPEAAARFREHSDKTLRAGGFVPTVSDPRVYVRDGPEGKALALVHVDDIGIGTTRGTDLMSKVKANLSDTYELSVNDEMGFYLGMQISRDRDARSITVRQRGYVDAVLEKFNVKLNDCPPSTPMLCDYNILSESPDLDAKGKELFMSKVGCLLYLSTQTRPDIMFAVSQLSRKSRLPTVLDMSAVDRVLEYVASTPDLGLCFCSGEGIKLCATVDASYACHPDMKSHTGCTLHIGTRSASFLSVTKKQTITADSSTAAEFVAAHTAVKLVMWARSLLLEMGFEQQGPTILYEDNKSTLNMFLKDGNGGKTRHLAIRFSLVREQVKEGSIKPEYLPTEDMTSDILTKALGPSAFLRLRPRLLGMLALKLRSYLSS